LAPDQHPGAAGLNERMRISALSALVTLPTCGLIGLWVCARHSRPAPDVGTRALAVAVAAGGAFAMLSPRLFPNRIGRPGRTPFLHPARRSALGAGRRAPGRHMSPRLTPGFRSARG